MSVPVFIAIFFIVGGLLVMIDILHNRICALEKEIVELQSTVIKLVNNRWDD